MLPGEKSQGTFPEVLRGAVTQRQQMLLMNAM
jgi:hypothetical protein